MLVHQLIYQGQDDQIAFAGKQAITYQFAQNKITQYRSYFYQQGVRAGNNVGLFSKNSPEFIYSYMAIASLGAVVVPLNFQLVPREIAYIVQDARMKHLITMSSLAIEDELIKCGYEQAVAQLIIPEFEREIDGSNLAKIPEESVAEEDPCVIIYTSGTTGNPKGAVLSHKNLMSNADAFTRVLPIAASDNVLCVLPMYHCFAWTCAVLGSLVKGATITILDAFVFKETISTIRESGITVMYGVPAMYNLFAAWGSVDDFVNVKLLVSGGASLPQKVSEVFYAKFNKSIVEGYGLSEASPVVCINPVEKTKVGSIGLPLPDVEIQIVDESGQIVPTGQVGELIVRGPNVMKGYFNLPEETARALRNGWLHTGDLAYRDDEGYVYIVDRLKDMIIVSGENVYPREIEELLYAYPGIVEAAVVGIPDRLRGQAPHAYLVVKDGETIDMKGLQDYLQGNLAGYKIPWEIVVVPALPKNSTGKIMKRVLREQAVQ